MVFPGRLPNPTRMWTGRCPPRNLYTRSASSYLGVDNICNFRKCVSFKHGDRCLLQLGIVQASSMHTLNDLNEFREECREELTTLHDRYERTNCLSIDGNPKRSSLIRCCGG